MASTAAVLNILVNAQTGSATASLTKLNTQLKATETQAAKTSGAAGGKFAKAAKVGLAAVAVGAAAAAKELYDIGSEFDSAYDKIRVGTGKTGKQLERLKKDFRNVVSSVPADFDDAAEAITGVEQRLGLTGKQLRQRSKQFLELSRITGTDLKGNIKAVSRSFEDWEVSTKNQAHQLDLFYRASQQSGASVEEITSLLVKFGSPLRQLGFEVGEATAMFASFEKAGVNMQTMLPGLKLALGKFLEQGKDPGKALKQTFQEMERGTISSTAVLKIFGKRAGADMMEAVEQGRFHLKAFQKQFESGNDTIRKAGEETMDASENFKLLGNRLKVLLEPAATAVFKAIGNLSGALARLNFKRVQHELGLTNDDMRALGRAAKILAQVWNASFDQILRVVKSTYGFIAVVFKEWVGTVRGAVKVISGLLEGDLGKAWEGVKEIFKSGVNGVIGFLNLLIDALNSIPGIDIGHIGTIGGRPNPGTSPKATKKDHGSKPATGKQRGGPIWGGDASGDSIPAMLERGEYVLNRKAVQAMGKRQLDAINFGTAPRFSVGSFIGSAASKAGNAAKGALGVANKGAGYFIGKLPKPNLPEPFAGLGPYIIGQVTDYIKSGFKSKKLGKFTGLGGPGVGGHPELQPGISSIAAAVLKRWPGLSITSTTGGGHATNSLHYAGRAVDLGGSTSYMLDAAGWIKQRMGSQLTEGIHNPNLSIAGGNVVSSGYWGPEVWADHLDHIHLGKQKGGLIQRLQKGGMPSWVHGSKTLNPDQLASLAAYVGMASPAYMGQIAMGESSGNPHAIGHDPGGTEGLGLWQITTGYNDALIAKYGGRSAMFDPLTNARAAAELLASSGPGAWYAPPTGPKGTVSPLRGGGGGGKAAATVKKVMGLGKGRSLAHHANVRKHNTAVHRNRQGIGRGVIPGVHGGGEVAAAGVEGEETDAQRESREATEALTAAIQEHAAEEKGMREELKRQTDFAEAASSSDAAVYMRAIADMISGNLGPRTYHSAQTAGSGSVGTF